GDAGRVLGRLGGEVAHGREVASRSALAFDMVVEGAPYGRRLLADGDHPRLKFVVLARSKRPGPLEDGEQPCPVRLDDCVVLLPWLPEEPPAGNTRRGRDQDAREQ